MIDVFRGKGYIHVNTCNMHAWIALLYSMSLFPLKLHGQLEFLSFKILGKLNMPIVYCCLLFLEFVPHLV